MPSGQQALAARLALVGDRSPHVRAHIRIPAILTSLADFEALYVDAYWVPTDEVEEGGMERFDAIWLVPGSPYRSAAGAVAAVRLAREHGIPYLGSCAGFQYAMVEFARHVSGLPDAGHAEADPGCSAPVIVPLPWAMEGQRMVRLEPGSLAERVLGTDETLGRYQCSYGLAAAYANILRADGMRFSGVDRTGEIQIAELPGHPFFLATLFQPELSDVNGRPHPAIRALARAAVLRHRQGRSPFPPDSSPVEAPV
ncbi:hypothetical protein RM550_11890 [Streptomyces sp. DSM 41527]|uniref:CTP synthase (glutamine hydrolyzing) n=1 Tax=Streptomyces mooreae TaxID=3075523 RepID=A0ABU2T5E4_9ACTN|nr:hypothetical protein [Streptomyces sp. DSM 41527]MDT0456433.1 hypothetical protein [Streptomyces sp. DSM 41527]